MRLRRRRHARFGTRFLAEPPSRTLNTVTVVVPMGETKMIEVRVSRDVGQSPQEVFAFWSDWTNNPSWQKGMESCTWTSEPPLRIGSTYDQVARFLGRPIISSFEVVEYEPDRKVRIKTTKSTLPLDITREVRPGPDGGTTLAAVIRGEPQGLMKRFEGLAQKMVERNVNADYDRLKAVFDGTGDGGDV